MQERLLVSVSVLVGVVAMVIPVHYHTALDGDDNQTWVDFRLPACVELQNSYES